MSSKIYIPFHKFKYLGGPSSFMMNLKDYLQKNDYNYCRSYYAAKGIFFPMGYRPIKLWFAKMLGMKVIQRLDGVYYPSKHGKKYYKDNRLQEVTYKKFADYIIFQSEYSKKQCFEMFGKIPDDKNCIVYNGANSDIFYPEPHNVLSNPIKFVTTGNFRNIDMLEPIILALDDLVGKFNFKLHIAGIVANEKLISFMNRDYIVNHGSLDLHSVADLLRKSNIFLYSHLNPPCPNSVIEAISSGLPIVGFDSGAMSELCHFSKELLANVSNDIFQIYEDFDFNKLKEKIQFCVTNFDYYKEIANSNSNLYSFDKCGQGYINVFNRLLDR